MQRWIAHLDLDCFFVSVERIKNRDLIGKPVIVGGSPDGRGVVASASYEARAFGVRSAMPTRRALQLCPRAIVVQGNHGDYSRYSDQIHNYLSTVAPIVERASIDEMNLDFTGCESLYNNNLPEFMHKLQKEIREKFELPCTIALASNRLVAKIAAGTVKPFGVITVAHGTEKQFLSPLPINVIPGVGKKAEEILRRKGILSIADCQPMSLEELEKLAGSFGRYLFEAVNGRGVETLVPDRPHKSISREETFARDLSDPIELEAILFPLVESVCATLREYRLKAKTVTVKYRFADFTTFTRRRSCVPTMHDPTIYAVAKQLLAAAFREKKPIRLIGVGLSNFVNDEEAEPQLFPPPADARKTIMAAVDKIRKKYGDNAIHIGGA